MWAAQAIVHLWVATVATFVVLPSMLPALLSPPGSAWATRLDQRATRNKVMADEAVAGRHYGKGFGYPHG
jgi:hypothetical protein